MKTKTQSTNYLLLFFILILLLIIFIIYKFKNLLKENFEKCNYSHLILNNNEITRLKNLFIEFDKLAQQKNINYFIICGTLLGAVRHGGLMSHDDDIDIGILDNDLDKLFSIEKDLNNIDIYIKPIDIFGYKLIDKKNTLWIDVFIFHNNNDDIYKYKYDEACKYWPNEWFYNDELYPLKKIIFNDILFNCPNNPNKYLDRAFKNWENEIHIYKPHKNFININEETGVFKITEENKKKYLCYSDI